ADGRLLKGAGKAPPTLPGVVRTQVLSRSGRGLLEGPHPLLQMVGFRVAGGEKMVRRVRGR
ncbi:MAG: hypothetical protein QF412_14955, partial [Planctomycetota bacterium]|nr:hypothetical protein [Planctomycetota bacterium]